MTYRSQTRCTALHQDSVPSSMKPNSKLRLIRPTSRQALYNQGQGCCTRLVEFPDSTSSVMLTMPSNFIGSSLCSDETERKFVPFLLTRSLSLLTHRQNGFRVCLKQVTETLLRGTHGISNITRSAAQTVLSTSMVSRVGEDRVHLVRSHCVLRHAVHVADHPTHCNTHIVGLIPSVPGHQLL